MQQVGKDAINPCWHSGQTAHFSKDFFRISSSKMPLTAAGLTFLATGASVSLTADRDGDIFAGSSGKSTVNAVSVLLPLVLVVKMLALPAKFQPDDALSLLFSALLVGCHACFLV